MKISKSKINKIQPTVSNSLRSTYPFFKLLNKFESEDREKLLGKLKGDKTAYNALHEIAFNTLKGNYKLNKNQKKRLKPYDSVMKNLCCSKNRKLNKKRQELIKQSGGFLPILIPAIATVLASIINKI
jgi:hypothetical protein